MSNHKNASGDMGTADGTSLDPFYRNAVRQFVKRTEDHHSVLAGLESEYSGKEAVLLEAHRANIARIREDSDKEGAREDWTLKQELESMDRRKEKEIAKVKIELSRLRTKARVILTSSSREIERAYSSLQKAGLGHLLSSLDHKAYLPEAPLNTGPVKAVSPPRPSENRRIVATGDINSFEDIGTGRSSLSSSLLEDATGRLKSPRLQDSALSVNNYRRFPDEILGGPDAGKNVKHRNPDTQERKGNRTGNSEAE